MSSVYRLEMLDSKIVRNTNLTEYSHAADDNSVDPKLSKTVSNSELVTSGKVSRIIFIYQRPDFPRSR